MFKLLCFKKIVIVIFFLSFFSTVFAEDIFLSLKNDKVNVRYGPSLESPIKYIYNKKNLPIKQIDKKENFRRIIDHKKNSGWIHLSQLKPINSIITLDDKILFNKPSNFSKPLALIRKGRILVVQKCEDNWCKVETKKIKGWIENNNVWGQVD